MPVVSSIYMGEPDDMRRRVEEYRAIGYICHSIKVGGEPGEDAARIAASLADKKPGEYFIADANGGMTVETAFRVEKVVVSGLPELPEGTAFEK